MPHKFKRRALNLQAVTQCQRAGFCLHREPGGKLLRIFVDGLEKIIAKEIAKKAGDADDHLPRNVYSNGGLVLKLYSASADFYLHVGYGNLNTTEFHALPLVGGSEFHSNIARAFNEIALEVRTDLPRCGACNLWNFCRTLRLQGH